MNRCFLSFFLSVALLLSVTPVAGGPPAAPKKPPAAEFDDFETPLQKAVKSAYRKNAAGKKDKMTADGPGGRKDKCAAAILANNDNQIAQFCDDVGTMVSESVGGAKDFKHPDGKAAGKRLVTRTKVRYASPKQKHATGDQPPPDKWPTEKLKGFERVQEYLPGSMVDPDSGGVSRSYGSTFLPEPDANDDHDCIDTLTGKHHSQAQCFDAAGAIVATLKADPVTAGMCHHTDGSVFFGDATDAIEDDCWDAKNVLKTTLIELIDEDGSQQLDNDGDGRVNEDPRGNGNDDNDCIAIDGKIHPCGTRTDLQPLIDEDGIDDVDDDGDGVTNEDPPTVRSESDCARFYQKLGMTPTADESDSSKPCDVGRALVKFANDRAVAAEKKKIFKAKDDGTYDPEAVDGVEPGREERGITITESFGVKCRPGTTYVEGVCISDTQLAQAGPEKLALLGLIGGAKAASASSPVIARVAMMGFTFSPPVIEWGYRIDEEVCVLGICVEVFYARIGYEFDLALGLRIPVEIELPEPPASVLAGRDHTIQTQLEPLDFTTDDYEAFCDKHDLDSEWFIGGGGGLTPCRRFGFTSFLDAMVPDSILPQSKKDGDELVARYTVFAGVQVRVLKIPVINWAVDSSIDMPAACTMMRITELLKNPGDIPAGDIAEFIKAMMGFGDGAQTGVLSVLKLLKDKGLACGTFEAPFGNRPDGTLRPFPFTGKYDIRADCAEAIVRGEVITIKGKPRPICTNMVLGVSGASLGIGLGLEATAGSNLIRGKWSTSEDASKSGTIDWKRSANESGAKVALTFRPDNYNGQDSKDDAKIAFDDLIYFLNKIELALNATLQFGGILSPIPDIGSFNIYRFSLSLGDSGIPIPQHPGTEAVDLSILVENYGLKVNVKPSTIDAALLVDADTLKVMPGTFGAFVSEVRNIGSFTGAFDNFRIGLSNRPDQNKTNLAFVIDHNNDHDCRATGSSLCTFRGVRWDGTRDDCYADSGAVREDRIECIDEDAPSTVQGLSREERDDDKDGLPDEDPPGDEWVTTPTPAVFMTQSITGITPYDTASAASGKALTISVNPFRHPLTRPGVYPIQVTADSTEAKAKAMPATDPIGNARVNAKDVSFIQVESFFEPQVVVLPNRDGGKPAVSKTYIVEGTNFGNANDSMSVKVAFTDYNQAQCTLTTLGRLPAGSDPACRYRAVPTAIPESWTTVTTLTPIFPEVQPGKLDPLGSATDSFAIAPPRTWAGMEDTTYRFAVTTVSQADPAEPPATRTFIAEHKVQATKESMTRYIRLEIDELIATVAAAEAAGLKVGGLDPIAAKPISMSNDRALEAVLAGDFKRASGIHSTTTRLVEAYVRVLNGGGKALPAALFADLHARCAAMLADLAIAEASMVMSAP